MKTTETENGKKYELPTIEESDRVVKSPAVIKKEQEAIEFFKTVDWNEWKKVFAEAEAENRREREEWDREEREKKSRP